LADWVVDAWTGSADDLADRVVDLAADPAPYWGRLGDRFDDLADHWRRLAERVAGLGADRACWRRSTGSP
ncbi:MAG: hypothetical protein ACK5PP_10845, partial [Acidimicrobiales bacterium]